MSNKVSIDYSKVFDTVKILKNLEESFGKSDFHFSFDSMEKYLRDINFKHDDCLDYKSYFDTIYEDIEWIRKRIDDLNRSLATSSISFINKEELTSNKMNKLVNMFQDTRFQSILKTELVNGDVTQVPEATPPSNDGGEINTVPIGIAIGATGVAGAIGAIVVDELYGPKTKQVKRHKVEPEIVEEYHISADDDYDDDNIDLEEDDYSNQEEVYPTKNEGYTAVREHREVDKFYGETSNLADDSLEYHPSLKEVEPSKKVDLTLDDEEDELTEFDE